MAAATGKRKDREAAILPTVSGLTADAPPSGTVKRLLTERGFATRVVRHLLHLPTRMETEDRRVLEDIIFPHLRELSGIRSVLFVGCDWYTRHYQRAYFPGTDYWTIDPAPSAKKFAGRQHIVAPLELLDEYFPEKRFDLILCNGVFGWGLNGREQCEQAFAASHSRLADGGRFILGWDDIPARTPVPLAEIESLQRFRPEPFAPLGGWRYLTDTPYRHTYDFYRK
jgi:SAM-dependent methyltransferase